MGARQRKNAGDWFGYSVAGAGDLDGDTKANIAVGAYRHAASTVVVVARPSC